MSTPAAPDRTEFSEDREKRISSHQGESAGLPFLTFYEQGHQFSNNTYLKGVGKLHFFGHPRAGWLNVTTEESREGRAKQTVRRRASMDLELRQVRELHAFLGRLLEGLA